jgi:hypothetical protein
MFNTLITTLTDSGYLTKVIEGIVFVTAIGVVSHYTALGTLATGGVIAVTALILHLIGVHRAAS